jgi:hypothetical protein
MIIFHPGLHAKAHSPRYRTNPTSPRACGWTQRDGAAREFPEYLPGHYGFSGRHDGGLLPPLKAGGPHEAILGAIQVSERCTKTGCDRKEASG